MRYYPAFLDLRGRPCLIIGGGQVAERKAISLLEAGADVTVVSPSLTAVLRELSLSGKIVHRAKTFEERDLLDAFLAIAATGSEDVNRGIARLCKRDRILVNVAAPPEESSFIVPSVVDRGELLIAVSSSGSSPALSKKIRLMLEKQFGPEYELFLVKMAAVRSRLKETVQDGAARSAVLKALAESDVIDLLKQGRVHEADRRIAEIAGGQNREHGG